MKFIIAQFKKGSILAYTLIVLSIMLMTVLSAATVTLIQKRNAQNTTDSTQAFYVAESASEVVLNKISKSPDSTLSDLGTCQDGIVTINDVPTGSAKVVFYSDEQGTKLNCFQKISQAREIKAIGYYADNSRAIKVAVAGGNCNNGLTVVASEPNAKFTQNDFSKITDFVENKKGAITLFYCSLSGGAWTVGNRMTSRVQTVGISDSNYAISFWLGAPGILNTDYFLCGVEGGGSGIENCSWRMKNSSGVDYCTGGWAVVGSCDCPSSC